MARKRSRDGHGKENILLPQVTQDKKNVENEVLSEEEQRAKDAVASIERDLFGGVGHPIKAAPSKKKGNGPDKTAAVAVAEPRSDEETLEVAELPPLSPELSEYDEGEVIEPISSPTPETATEARNKALAESSNDDFKFLLDMDYEDELGNTIGFEKIRAYHETEMNGHTSARRRRNGHEFEVQKQDSDFRRAYARQRTGKIVHLVFSLLLLLLLMVYERPAGMARLLGGPFNGAEYPVPYILFGMQLLLLDVALSYKSLWEGFLRLVRFSPVDYSFTSVLVVATFLYHLVQIFLPHTAYPALYLSPTALCLALLSCVEFLNWYRESLAFDVVSARVQKYALVSRVSVGGKGESAKERLFHDEDESELCYARPVGFIRNYFANTAQHMEHHRNLGAQLLLILALGVALGLFALAGGADAELVFRTVFATVLLSAPAASLLLTSLPMFFAAVLRLRGKAAIIGERPIAECSTPATVVLPDSDIFASMEHEHLRLMQNCDHHSLSVLTRALLEKVGSPLAEAFSVEEESRMDPEQLTLLDIAREGVFARVGENGATILCGTIDYLQKSGIPVPGVAEDLSPAVSNRLLCIAMGGRVCALFLVRYQLQQDVRALVRELDRAGIPLAIRTKDPCVREEVFERLFTHIARPVQVIKPSVKEMELRADRVDTTVAAIDSCKELARAYVACRRIRRVGVWGKLLQTLSMTLGAAIAALLALLHTAPSSLVVTVWLIMWCALYAMLSYTSLRREANDGEI